jgi:hypothetical protein
VRRASKGAFRRTAYKVLIDLLLVCFVQHRDHRAAARGRSLPRPGATSREAPAASRCRLAAFGPGPGLAGAGWRGTGR